MIQSFFESIKYAGHLLPLSLLRIFVGYFYLQQFLADWKMHIIKNTNVSEVIVNALTSDRLPYWYRIFMSDHVVSHWSVYVFIFVGLQLAVALSFLFGYLVRPFSLLAVFISLNYMLLSSAQMELFFKLLMACQIMFAWIGAGRCLGLDYYFYKRYRGIWW